MRLICSICRGKFSLHSEVSALECGHLFHQHCIIKWCETNLTCPCCRFKLKNFPFVVEFQTRSNTCNHAHDSDYEELMRDLQVLREERKKLKLKSEQMKDDLSNLRKEAVAAEKNARRWKFYDLVWKREYKYAKLCYHKRERLKLENGAMEAKIMSLTSLKNLINETGSNIYDILLGKPITSSTIKELCTFVQAMKYKLKLNQEHYKKKRIELLCRTQNAEKKFVELERKKKEKKQVSHKSVQTDTPIRKVKKKKKCEANGGINDNV